MSIFVPYTTVSASSTVKSPIYTIDNGNTQYQFIYYTGDKTWTANKAIAGQPTDGTYLKKGDGLFYYTSGGNSASISIGANFGAGSVSISIPLGKLSSSTNVGGVLYASSKGYYKIYMKKQVTPKVVYYRQRKRIYNYPQGYVWTDWSTKVYSTSYEVNKVVATLVKQ